MGLHYHMMVNPNTTALPLYHSKRITEFRIWFTQLITITKIIIDKSARLTC